MKLQHEANVHMNRKQTKFADEFNKIMKPLKTLLTSELYETPEQANALLHLVEVELWAKRGVEIWGVK
jgi:hypothetical protein